MKTVGSGRVRVLTIFAAFIAAVVAILGLGSASSYAAPGNNGTVKVNDTLIDQIPDNAPHPECAFNVQWFNFDGVIVTSQVTFEAQDQDIEVTTVTGDTSANFRGGPGPNHSEDYILKFEGEPHPQQGYHVKVTISTNDSNGNDTKSKVFWVSPCQTPTPTTSTTSTTSTSTTTEPTSTTSTSTTTEPTSTTSTSTTTEPTMTTSTSTSTSTEPTMTTSTSTSTSTEPTMTTSTSTSTSTTTEPTMTTSTSTSTTTEPTMTTSTATETGSTSSSTTGPTGGTNTTPGSPSTPPLVQTDGPADSSRAGIASLAIGLLLLMGGSAAVLAVARNGRGRY